jgi:hypothetical protein
MQPVRNRGYGRRLAAVLATGSLVLSFAAAASADTIYNTLDGTVDATAEVMNLTAGGSNGTTTLQVQVDSHPDHTGCNIQGGPHQLAMSVSSSDPTIATAAFGGGDSIFDTCDEVLTVVVTPSATTAGQTTISFSGVADTSSDPHITFSYAEATFVVNVTAGTTPPPVVCDADPAAPAWANAILRANGIKNKTTIQNTISSVAKHMTNGAMFDGVVKNAHPAYETAVYNYMKNTLSLNLAAPDWSAIARPGWECGTQSS